jgi:hypothetical protein
MEVREIVEAETGEGLACYGNEVGGPLCLTDPSMRLAMGEIVVFVNAGQRWRATVGIFPDRGVHAFVITSRGAALEAGFSVVSWQPPDPDMPAAINGGE